MVLVGVSQAGLHMSKELLGGKKVKPSSSRVLVTPCQNGKKPLEARAPRISGLKCWVLKPIFLA